MKKHLIWGAAALLALLLAPSCKKEQTTTTPGLTGLMVVNTTSYVPAGAEVTFKADASKITTSDKSTPGTIGLYWQVDAGKKDTLTLDVSKSNPEYKVSGVEAGKHTVTCYAFSANYYNTSSSTTFRAIDPESAISGLPEQKVEYIGGHPYPVFISGDLCWMARNIYGKGGRSYSDASVLDSVFGNYYTWLEAHTVCPDGWHLPSGVEFDSLGKDAGALMVNASFLNEEMWSYWPKVNITNSLGFNALPTGYLDTTSESLSDNGLGEYAAWWVADSEGDGLGGYRYIFEENPTVQKGRGSSVSLALNVRCVRLR